MRKSYHNHLRLFLLPRCFLIFLVVNILMFGVCILPHPLTARSNKFLQTFLVYYGGGPTLRPGDEVKLAKYDILDLDRFRYDDINGATWQAIKAVNPDVEIYLYQSGTNVDCRQDLSFDQEHLNTIGRFSVSRNHSMGSLAENPEFFLLNEQGQRIVNRFYPNCLLLDFGLPRFQKYWIESAITDILSKPWRADGIFVDNCLALVKYAQSPYSKCKKYPAADSWNDAMNRYISTITAALHAKGQKIFVNRGNTRFLSGFQAWIDLDKGPTPPDIVMEEGAFAVNCGKKDVQFFPELHWRRQIDIADKIQHSKVAYLSHTDLDIDEVGIDNWGKPVTFWQVLWYAMGSYHLAKKTNANNCYFMFEGNCDQGSYRAIWWFDEYDLIDLGNPLGKYKISSLNGVNIYWREFEKGYIYVNPTNKPVNCIPLKGRCKLLSHKNLRDDPKGLPDVKEIALGGHDAAFLLKSQELENGNSSRLSPPRK